MTAFVLVPGTHMGGWLWREVAGRLRAAGSEAYEATLTGMGDRRHLAGPQTDLETHTEDLTQLIDHVDAPEVVLVAHCYGSYPVLAAADRRPERVSRVVYVDAPLPQDGHSMLGQVREQMQDEVIREAMLRRAAEAQDGWRMMPPALDEARNPANLTGVSEEARVRLNRLAAPQPLGTFTQPLRLAGGTAGMPMTGVFCTAGGPGIAMVEALVASGDPRFQELAEPRWGFFELATGHWPMLSCPDELAEVLRRAAAGEGHRVGAGRQDAGANRQDVGTGRQDADRVAPV
ncbi:alpha/beta hydrolase [Streptomyces sp. NPDC051173]|uniref:alpha/beta fold hydrolase n=1 Tax=Streptomyces sp. NPDC051173 TaxID=3155164 RepID=UPI00344B63EB